MNIKIKNHEPSVVFSELTNGTAFYVDGNCENIYLKVDKKVLTSNPFINCINLKDGYPRFFYSHSVVTPMYKDFMYDEERTS